MVKKINHSSLFSTYLLIVSVILILTPCHSLADKHFGTEQESSIFEKQSTRLTTIIDSIRDLIKNKLPGQQSIKCLLSLQSILNDKSIISIPDQEVNQKITIKKQKLKELQFQGKQDSQSQCQIVTNQIEILLLQNNEINKVLIKSRIAQSLTQSQLSKCQQNLKDCQNKVLPNDCSKCTCPPSRDCSQCQKARKAAKQEGDNTKNENEKLKGKIAQYQAEQKNWSQALGVVLPKLKNQANYAISSQNIGNFNFNKISAILNQINSVADQSKNQNLSQKSSKHRTLVKQLTEEFIYFINVTTKAYSKVVDERNSLLDLSKSITAQLKQCNKVLKNEK